MISFSSLASGFDIFPICRCQISLFKTKCKSSCRRTEVWRTEEGRRAKTPNFVKEPSKINFYNIFILLLYAHNFIFFMLLFISVIPLIFLYLMIFISFIFLYTLWTARASLINNNLRGLFNFLWQKFGFHYFGFLKWNIPPHI